MKMLFSVDWWYLEDTWLIENEAILTRMIHLYQLHFLLNFW